MSVGQAVADAVRSARREGFLGPVVVRVHEVHLGEAEAAIREVDEQSAVRGFWGHTPPSRCSGDMAQVEMVGAGPFGGSVVEEVYWWEGPAVGEKVEEVYSQMRRDGMGPEEAREVALRV